MALDSLEKLFIEELRDTYSAEKQLLRALAKLAKNVGDDELRQAFEDHRAETEEHVSRLEEIFTSLDLKPRAKKCKGVEGIVEEANEMMEEDGDRAVIDAALIAGAQRAEHYEISAYGTLRAYASRLGNSKAEELLAKTLEEEKAADEKLNVIAERVINPRAQKGEKAAAG